MEGGMGKNILKKNPDYIKRVIEGEVLLMPLMQSSAEDFLYCLNESAAEVWDLLDETQDIEDIEEKLKEKYDISADEAKEKLSGLIKELKEIKALV